MRFSEYLRGATIPGEFGGAGLSNKGTEIQRWLMHVGRYNE